MSIDVFREQLQLVIAAAGEPRVDARLDGGPVGDDEHVLLGGDQGGAQHALQDVGDARAVGRRHVLPCDQRSARRCGVLQRLAGEVMDLEPERTSTACSASTSEDEGAAHSFVVVVGKVGGASEFGDGAGPDVVGRLDNLHDVPRNFIAVLHRQQVTAHGLVD